MIDKAPHLKLVDSAKEKAAREEAKKAAYEKRGSSQRNHYAQARLNVVIIDTLKKALLSSVVLDPDGGDPIHWTKADIEDMLGDLKDPGSVRDNRKK